MPPEKGSDKEFANAIEDQTFDYTFVALLAINVHFFNSITAIARNAIFFHYLVGQIRISESFFVNLAS